MVVYVVAVVSALIGAGVAAVVVLAMAKSGTQGRPGVAGVRGSTGVQGPVGSQGAQGLKGDVGLNGVNGFDGAPGPQGAPGPDILPCSQPRLQNISVYSGVGSLSYTYHVMVC
jgi:Collagen triple helix repeat (20 copies)